MAAADQTLGKPHDPSVNENDPAITVASVELRRPDTTIRGYAAMPRSTSAKTPGVVVVQHIWGVDAQIRDVVRRFAKAGYVTVAPNLYERFNAPSGDNATDYKPFHAIAAKLDRDQLRGDVVAAATWIREHAGVDADHRPPKIGVTGFCMGGGIALSVAAATRAFDACAMWYGSVTNEYAEQLKIPLLGSFGGRDTSIPADGVRDFQAHLKVPNDIKIYPEAGHAFFDDTRPSYVPTAAADAWSRTLAWFAKYLAPKNEKGG